MPVPMQSVQARVRDDYPGRVTKTVYGSLACAGCLIRYCQSFSPPAGLPAEISCEDQRSVSCLACEENFTHCANVPKMMQFDATRIHELLAWSSWLFDPVLEDPYDPGSPNGAADFRVNIAYAQHSLLHTFSGILSIHRGAFALGELDDPPENTRAIYQTQVFQRMSLAQQRVQLVHNNPDLNSYESYDRATALRLQPLDAGYRNLVVAVRTFMRRLEELVVNEYDQAKWDMMRGRLVNEDVVQFCEG
ncbi:hypothetical protein GGR58DRAFT_503142 [Xylaria digitata]|nr:hypothetical protein GGR58DRAFT_503142 [Xylaria digitata]